MSRFNALRFRGLRPVAVAAGLTLFGAGAGWGEPAVTEPVASGDGGGTAGRPVVISLEDQFRTRHDTGSLRGHAVVLVYAERHGAKAGQELGRALHVRFHPSAKSAAPAESARQPVAPPPGWPQGVQPPDVKVIAVACLSEIPSPFHILARRQFRSDSPHMPVWLDFEGVMQRSFGLVSGVPNVVLLDTDGRVHAVRSGRFEPAEIEALVASIEEIRRRSLGQPRTAALPTP
jgi:hypothetical protein